MRLELNRLADPAAAPAMAAYMKTTQPFFGVAATPRREAMRRIWREHAPRDALQWRERVGALFHQGKGADTPADNPILPRRDSSMRPPLWKGRREWFYMACEYADRGRGFHDAASLPLFRSMIEQAAWWDVVDWVAGKFVGNALSADRAATTVLLERWISDENLWLRRSAIIAQLGRKHETDTSMLARFCLATAHEKDFFIRKAIGWALRQHARTDPRWVTRFVDEHRARLSPLSVREATLRL